MCCYMESGNSFTINKYEKLIVLSFVIHMTKHIQANITEAVLSKKDITFYFLYVI